MQSWTLKFSKMLVFKEKGLTSFFNISPNWLKGNTLLPKVFDHLP